MAEAAGIAVQLRDNTARLLGRQRELDQLLAWQQSPSARTDTADSSEPTMMVIQGPAGIGKTHLAMEFLASADATAGRDDITAVGLTGSLPGDANPFMALAKALVAELHGRGQALPEIATQELQPLLGSSPATSPAPQATPQPAPRSTRGPRRAGAPQQRARRSLDLNRINDRPHHRAFAQLIRAAATGEAESAGVHSSGSGGNERSVLLLIDDLQWANPAAIHLLRDLVLNPPTSRFKVLATCRPDPPAPISSLMQELQACGGLAELELEGLDLEAVSALIARHGSDEAESLRLAESLRGMTRGNPLLLQTVLATSSPGDGPIALRAAVTAGMADLAPEALTVLRQLAVLGRSAPESTLLHAITQLDLPRQDVPTSATDLRRLLHAAVAAGLVEHHPNTKSIRFTHDEYREATVASLSADQLNAHHAAAAQALQTDDTSGASHVHHLMQSGAPPAEVARAAADAARHATANEQWDEAIPLLTIAKSMLEANCETNDGPGGDGPSDPQTLPDRSEILASLAEAQRRTAHPDADATVAAAYALAEADDDLDAMVRMALLRPRSGDFSLLGSVDQDVFGRLETCLTRVDPERQPENAALIRAAMAEELLFAEGDRRRKLAEEAVHYATQSGDESVRSVAMLARRNTMSAPDQLDDRIRAGRELVDHATRLHNDWDLAWAHMALSGNLLERGDRDGSELRVDLASGINDRLRSRYIEYILATRRTSSLIMNEEFEKAELSALADIRLGESAGFDEGYTVGVYGSQLCKIRTAQGRPAELVDSFEFMIAQVPTFLPYRAALAWVLAEARIDGAAEQVNFVTRDDFAHIPFDYWWVTTMSLVGRTAAMIGDRRTAAHVLDRLTPHSGQVVWSGTVALGPVDWQLGGLAASLGDTQSGVHWLERAVEQCTRLGMRCSLRSCEPELAAARSGTFTLEDLRLTPLVTSVG